MKVNLIDSQCLKMLKQARQFLIMNDDDADGSFIEIRNVYFN